MPNIADTKKVPFLRKGRIRPTHRYYIWQSCMDCGKERWVQTHDGKAISERCLQCGAKKRIPKPLTGNQAPGWKGGRVEEVHGHILVWVAKDNFFASMRNSKGYVFEHRLVMAEHLRRCLHKWETVHHKNGIKSDNRIENLMITTMSSHLLEHSKGYRDGYLKGLYDGHEARIKQLEKRVTLLEAENILLQQEMPIKK